MQYVSQFLSMSDDDSSFTTRLKAGRLSLVALLFTITGMFQSSAMESNQYLEVVALVLLFSVVESESSLFEELKSR